METHRLICHPDTPARTVRGIDVELVRKPGALWLRYYIDGVLDALALPPPATAVRKDGLWQTTCLEAFVRDSAGEGYREFNFSTSGEWAAYSFTSYRDGMEQLPLKFGPEISLDVSDSHLALEATIPVEPGDYRFALSAVIEETDGTKSYWALVHPSGKPDFHHPDCFALHLIAPDNA
ncbi:MAG: DOMON-like domain-containing protein [Novosphingobium sp.]